MVYNVITRPLIYSGYPGLIADAMHLLKSEKETLLVIAGVNLANWLFNQLDMLIFAKRTFSSIFFIYAPINMIGTGFPGILGGILGYIFATVFDCAVYIAVLALLRRKWHRNKD